jgi:hypothetical protein
MPTKDNWANTATDVFVFLAEHSNLSSSQALKMSETLAEASLNKPMSSMVSYYMELWGKSYAPK